MRYQIVYSFIVMNTNSVTIAKLVVSLWVANFANLTLMLNAMDVMSNGIHRDF